MRRSYLFLCCFVLLGVAAAQPEKEDGACTPSAREYTCMREVGGVTMHWTVGPFNGRGEIPNLADGEIAISLSAETIGFVAISFAQSPGEMAPADVILGWVVAEGVRVRTYAIVEKSIVEARDQTDDIGMRPIAGSEEGGITTVSFILTGDFTFDVDLTKEVDMNWAVGPSDGVNYHGSNRGSFKHSFYTDVPEDTGDDTSVCVPSTLAYACMAEKGEVVIHWTVGPVKASDDLPALDDDEIAMAVSAETAGYVAVSFPQRPGFMAPADVILGWVDPEGVELRTYHVIEQSIVEDRDQTEDIGARIIGGTERGGVTTIEFVIDGDFTFPVDLTDIVDMNWAFGPSDGLNYHGPNKGSFTIDFYGMLLSNQSMEVEETTDDIFAEALSSQAGPDEILEADLDEILIADVEEFVEDFDLSCESSTLDGYQCMRSVESLTMHWSVGPFDGEGEVPELEAGEIAVALSAETIGYVAMSFAQSPGKMFPADAILGWVHPEGPEVHAYSLREHSIVPDRDETDEIGVRLIGGSQQGGVTTVSFVLEGDFTFPVDLTDTVDLNWAWGPSDGINYHGANRGSFTLDFYA